MEDVVAVEVEYDDGSRAYFLTWGRIQHRVDPAPLARLVLRHASGHARTGDPVRARVCGVLAEAASLAKAPYFYEALMKLSYSSIPADNYEAWRLAREDEMKSGGGIYFCGLPGSPQEWKQVWTTAGG